MPAFRIPDSRTLIRYGIVALIVLSLGYIYAVREIAARSAAGDAPKAGVIDTSVQAKVGERAPDFALEDAATGRLVKLSDYRGKTVVLNFWATWCVPCRQEMPDLQRTSVGGQAKGDVVVIGVNDKEPANVVNAFTKDLGVTFPILLDRTSAVRAQYGVVGLPGTFFIDRDGVIRSQNFGPVGTLLPEGIAAASRGTATASATAAVGSATPTRPASKPGSTPDDGY